LFYTGLRPKSFHIQKFCLSKCGRVYQRHAEAKSDQEDKPSLTPKGAAKPNQPVCEARKKSFDSVFQSLPQSGCTKTSPNIMEPQIMTWAFRQRLQQVDWVKVVVLWKSVVIENRDRSL
jgi:hypothetical protein